MPSLEVIFDKDHRFILLSNNSYLPSGMTVVTGNPYKPQNIRKYHPTRGERDHHVYHADLVPYGNIPEQELSLKWVRGVKNIAKLQQEAWFYEAHLKDLQGVVVPRFYGFYEGEIDGVEIGCMVLEHCFGALRPQSTEFKRQIMIQTCRLHKAGILHNQILDQSHFVPYGPRGIRIVDFTKATTHDCPGSVPILARERRWFVPGGCSELDALEKAFGRHI